MHRKMGHHGVQVVMGLFVVALAGSTAEAINPGFADDALRAWDRKIESPGVDGRFTVLTKFFSEAVLDKETQLVWEQSPLAIIAGQEGALQGCFGRNIGGRMGWRLPSIHELASLVEPCIRRACVIALPPFHPFAGVYASGYWSATTLESARYPGQFAYYVDFSSPGEVKIQDKGLRLNVWCVRGSGH